jgi:hypothetical protein
MFEYKIHFAYSTFELDTVRRKVDRIFSSFAGYAVNLQDGIWERLREPSQCITLVAFASQLPAIQRATAELLYELGEDTALVTGSKLDTYVAVHSNGDVFSAFDEPEKTDWEKAYRRPTAAEYKPVHGGYPDVPPVPHSQKAITSLQNPEMFPCPDKNCRLCYSG